MVDVYSITEEVRGRHFFYTKMGKNWKCWPVSLLNVTFDMIFYSIFLSNRSIVWTYYNPDEMFQRPRAQSSQEMSSPRTEENGGKRKVHDIVFYIATLDIFAICNSPLISQQLLRSKYLIYFQLILGVSIAILLLVGGACLALLLKSELEEAGKITAILIQSQNCVLDTCQSVSPAICQMCPSPTFSLLF